MSRRLAIEVEASSPPRIHWTSPPSANHISCAIFTCEPTFRDRLDGAVTPEEEAILDIYNYNACALARFVSDTEVGSVDLTARMGLLPQVEACSADGPALRRTYESLSIGCWAYDDYHVIAASDLIAIEPSILVPAFPQVPDDATCAVDGRDCYDAERGFFGLCLGNACQPRCALGRAQDCQFAAFRFLDEPLDTPCRWACDPVQDSLTGVCRPL